MSFTPQDLVHYLQAASGAIPDDGDRKGIYLVVEEDNDLIEKLWTGSEIRPGLYRVGCEEGHAGAVPVE